MAVYREWLESDPAEIRRKLEDDGAILSTDYFVENITRGNSNLVVRMIAAGIDLNSVTSNGIHPLSEAVLLNDKYLIDLLMERGADPHLRDEAPNGFNRGLLHYAAKSNNVQLAQQLLDMGEPVDLIDSSDRTPLEVAIVSGQTTAAEFLIDNGADPLREDHGGSVPILLAAGNGQEDIVRILLECGADVNHTHERGWTPLLLSLFYNHGDTARFLMEKGADVKARMPKGYGAAGISASLGNADMLRTLIDAGAPVDFVMEEPGLNIIYACVENGLSDFIDELVNMGVDPNRVNTAGATPLDLAREMNDADAVAILEKYRPATPADPGDDQS